LKRFVNGEEVELTESGAEVVQFGDRLMVRSNGKADSALAVKIGETVHVSFRGQQYVVEKSSKRTKRAAAAHSGEMRAPMPGLIVDVLVSHGDQVVLGQKLLVLEAMKTQQPFVAPFDGTVSELQVSKSDQVVEGQLLAVVEPISE
jgi:3-methylcrotonyl-CoA carboxylase alpha subunit